MNLAEIPIFSMLRSRLGYLTERQKVIAQNIANSDTVRYVGQDLKPFSFDAKVQMHQAQSQSAGVMAVTQPGHMSSKNEKRPGQVKSLKSPDSETTLNGNSVVLEDEMIKMSDARMDYDTAISFYQKSMNMLRMAARPPGRG
jgi:flagellar basal-body rod protein FlgB